MRSAGGERTVREKAAGVARSARERIDASDDTRSYEARTRDDLYRFAAERGIAGRSTMRKDELIAALRDKR